ncbi:(2Fe-2S)-binding protein [Paenibacillus sp. CAU 1782]
MAELSFRDLGEAAASLSRYFAITLHSEPASDRSFSYTAEDLIAERSLVRILERQEAALGQPGLHVTGTLFAKRYSVWARGALAAWSLFDVPLSLEHGKVGITLANRGIMYYTAYPASFERLEPGVMDRSAMTRQYIMRLEEHLMPILRAVSSCTGANEKVMWSIIGHNVYSLYASLASNSEFHLGQDRLAIIQEDWGMLASAAFLDSPRYKVFKHPRWTGPPLYLRKHCCLAHKLESHGYCASCPKLANEERLTLLMANTNAND